jgi:multisubunit Na+/H+ antiporter MnhB subunit
MTPEQWLTAGISCAVCSGLTVLLMQVVKKYDTEQRLRSIRLLIVFGAALISSFVVFTAGAFPLHHLPLQITATFTIATLFHSWILHAIEKKIKDKIEKTSEKTGDR